MGNIIPGRSRVYLVITRRFTGSLAHLVAVDQAMEELQWWLKERARLDAKCNYEVRKHYRVLIQRLMLLRQIKTLKPEDGRPVLVMLERIKSLGLSGNSGLSGLIDQLHEKYHGSCVEEDGLLLAHEAALQQMEENLKGLLAGKKIITGCKCEASVEFSYALSMDLLFFYELGSLKPEHAKEVLEGLMKVKETGLNGRSRNELLDQLIERYKTESKFQISSVEEEIIRASAG